jgi:iron complex outermembrane receptor protein
MTRRLLNRFFITALFCLAAASSAFAQAAAGTINGKVTYGSDNSPLHNASVQIVQLKRTVQTNEDGSYSFEGVQPGRYTILAHQDGFSDITKTIVLTVGANSSIDFQLQVSGVKEQVTVTASGAEQSTFESFQSVSTVGSDQITQRASTSLGEVLEGESGVAKRSFGTGSSRPVIRGFDGDRVLIAQDGVRSGSLGSQSGDHGEPVDTLSAERIEVVKGPATLLYGSNAIGGVVNIISNHEDSAHKGLRGFFTGLGGTNNNQFGTSGGLEYGYKKFMIFGDGSFQRTGDYHSPLGVVPNSAARSAYGSIGGGYFADKGFFTTTFNYDKRRYGIPFAGFFESGGVSNDEEIDLRARTYNVKFNGGFRDIDSFVTSGKFTVNFNKYRHQELEGEEVGTNFFNKSTSYRGTFEQKGYKSLTGRFGFEGFNRDYETVGAEQLIDGKVRQDSFSVFGLEELKMGRVSFQFGGRVERNKYNPENPLLLDRDFTGFSGAAGVRIGLWEGGAFVVNYSNSYRAPALEELYNNGPHIGTVSFEIGNQNLQRERANGIDFGLRQQSNRVRADFNVFYYRISNFVYLAYADEDSNGFVDIEDNLPIARYSQADSQYFGAEFNADVTLHKYVNAFFNADFVRAKLVDSDLNLPRIPPAKARIGLDFHYKDFSIRPEAYFAGAQNRLHPLETRTAGYGIINLAGSYARGTEHYAHIFSVNAFNLFDKEYRNHLSFIKDLAPEIGRGVRVSYTVRFF